VEHFGVVSAHIATDLDADDIFTSSYEQASERSHDYQDHLHDVDREAINLMREKVLQKDYPPAGRPGIIGVSINHSPTTCGGKNILLVVVSGTAVRLRQH